MSIGCAGFAVLTPFNRAFSVLTAASWAALISRQGVTRRTLGVVSISALLAASQTLIGLYNTGWRPAAAALEAPRLPPPPATTRPGGDASGAVEAFSSSGDGTPPPAVATASPPPCQAMAFTVLGLGCAACAARVKAVVAALPWVACVSLDFGGQGRGSRLVVSSAAAQSLAAVQGGEREGGGGMDLRAGSEQVVGAVHGLRAGYTAVPEGPVGGGQQPGCGGGGSDAAGQQQRDGQAQGARAGGSDQEDDHDDYEGQEDEAPPAAAAADRAVRGESLPPPAAAAAGEL